MLTPIRVSFLVSAKDTTEKTIKRADDKKMSFLLLMKASLSRNVSASFILDIVPSIKILQFRGFCQEENRKKFR